MRISENCSKLYEGKDGTFYQVVYEDGKLLEIDTVEIPRRTDMEDYILTMREEIWFGLPGYDPRRHGGRRAEDLLRELERECGAPFLVYDHEEDGYVILYPERRKRNARHLDWSGLTASFCS